MEVTKLSTKGQVILPKAIRDSRAWDVGTEFTVEDVGEGILLRPLHRIRETTLDQVAGCLKYTGPRKSIAQMNASIAQQVKKRHDSGRY
jgi:AbrB family looped-hinge helix DNA binding protein